MTRIVLAIAALAATLCFAATPGQAGQVGNAPWCSVQNLGMGEFMWDCEYATAAACAPTVIAGSSCGRPGAGTSSATLVAPVKF